MTARGSAETRSVHDRLLDAAEACLRSDGHPAYDGGRHRRDAGVSRTWLYRHFPDKPAILVSPR